MGQVLYRKYRPKGLGDIVGQEHVTATLKHALEQGTISHAYLFTGPRGVGKTSVARILAHEINRLPYTDESIHLDIIEIDAASNRRIDEIRDLRDKVHIVPTSAKYKVYIIDEVHMLTREAFNALLKTLEEPPAHVVFILATTEAHKLPETIISRTQRFTFKPVPLEQVVAHLQAIAAEEKIGVDDEALQLIAGYGEGSFRDSISLLDQVRNQTGQVTADDVRAMLGLAPDVAIEQLVGALAAHDALRIVETLQQLELQGFEAARITVQLGAHMRTQLLDRTAALPAGEVLSLLGKLLDVASANNPNIALELILLGVAFSGEQARPVAETPSQPNPKKVQAAAPIVMPKAETSDQLEPRPKPLAKKSPPANLANDELWPKVLATIKHQHNTLYSVLRMAVPQFAGDHLELGLKFAFHQKRLNDAKNKQIIAETIAELSGRHITIDCVLVEQQPAPEPKDIPPATATIDDPPGADINTISNIFGGAELLES